MNRKHLSILFLTTLLFFACENSENNNYIISKEDSINKVKNTRPDGVVLMPPVVLQGIYNFLIDSTGKVYYYSIQEIPGDGAIHDEIELDKAHFMNLKPNNIFKIPKGHEKVFFQENVINLKGSWHTKHVFVGSSKDTIRNPFINYLKEVKVDSSRHISLTIRLLIQEEREVLKHKIEGKFYDPLKIKWDSTKMTFK